MNDLIEALLAAVDGIRTDERGRAGRLRHVVSEVHQALRLCDDHRDALPVEVTTDWLARALPDLVSAHIDRLRPGEQRAARLYKQEPAAPAPAKPAGPNLGSYAPLFVVDAEGQHYRLWLPHGWPTHTETADPPGSIHLYFDLIDTTAAYEPIPAEALNPLSPPVRLEALLDHHGVQRVEFTPAADPDAALGLEEMRRTLGAAPIAEPSEAVAQLQEVITKAREAVIESVSIPAESMPQPDIVTKKPAPGIRPARGRKAK